VGTHEKSQDALCDHPLFNAGKGKSAWWKKVFSTGKKEDEGTLHKVAELGWKGNVIHGKRTFCRKLFAKNSGEKNGKTKERRKKNTARRHVSRLRHGRQTKTDYVTGPLQNGGGQIEREGKETVWGLKAL